MRVRLSNVKGMGEYLKRNHFLIRDVTDRTTIGDRYLTVDPKDYMEIGEYANSKVVLHSGPYILVVTKGDDGRVATCEAVEDNENNRGLVRKYVEVGRLDPYDEFVRSI